MPPNAALAEIAGLTHKPFTEVELKRAKDGILNSFLSNKQGPKSESANGWSLRFIRRTTWNYGPLWKR